MMIVIIIISKRRDGRRNFFFFFFFSFLFPIQEPRQWEDEREKTLFSMLVGRWASAAAVKGLIDNPTDRRRIICKSKSSARARSLAIGVSRIFLRVVTRTGSEAGVSDTDTTREKSNQQHRHSTDTVKQQENKESKDGTLNAKWRICSFISSVPEEKHNKSQDGFFSR